MSEPACSPCVCHVHPYEDFWPSKSSFDTVNIHGRLGKWCVGGPEFYLFIYMSTLGVTVIANQELGVLRGLGTFMSPHSSVTLDRRGSSLWSGSSENQHSACHCVNLESDPICFYLFANPRNSSSMRPVTLKLQGGWEDLGGYWVILRDSFALSWGRKKCLGKKKRGERKERGRRVGKDGRRETRGCLVVAFDGLLGIRINISHFWPHLQSSLLVMKCFASVQIFSCPDFYLFT